MNTTIGITNKGWLRAGALALAVTLAGAGASYAQGLQGFGGDAETKGAYRTGNGGATFEAEAPKSTPTPDALGDQTLKGSYREGGVGYTWNEPAAPQTPMPDAMGDQALKGSYRD